MTAGRDLNIKSTTKETSNGQALDRAAGVYVTGDSGLLIASAGRDVNVAGALIASEGSAAVGAGRDINIGTVTESSSTSRVSTNGKAALSSSQSREIGSAIVANDNVRLAAGNDLNIRASAIASAGGALVASATHDINITAGQATSNSAAASVGSSKSLLKKTTSSAFASNSTTEVLSSSLSGNTVALVAGNDVNVQAARLRSEEAMSLSAGRDVNLTTATRTTEESRASQSKTSATGLAKALAPAAGTIVGAALLGGKSSSSMETRTLNEAVGTSVSAGSLQIVSGRDTTLQAATVVADGDLTVVAGRNLTIESAQSTSVGANSQSNSKSGMVGTWYNPAIGNVKSAQSEATTGTSQVGSQLASLQGDVTLVAGDTYRQTASSVMALGQAGALVGGDVNILAKNVLINEAYNTEQLVAQGRSSSTIVGGSASVGGISTDSLRNTNNTLKAMGDTSDSRIQSLGAANLAMSGKQAYDTANALAGGASMGEIGYKVSVNVSRNKSEYANSASGSEAVGSSIVGANNVNIVAIGGGEGSNIHAIGSTIAAGNTVNLAADNAITLEASKNTFEQRGTNSSSGQSVGVGFAAGSQNGFTLELGASKGKGNENQDDVSYNNTKVSGGKAVNITSGGDLNMKGAVVEADRVTADVGGNLNIESLQDTSVGQSRQSSSGVNLSLCIPPFCYGVSTVGGNAASAKANGNFVSVGEQSGIKAGDGGFDVNVKGNTDLRGAVIESTQAAVDAGKNSFKTGGELTMSDLQNKSESSGSSYAVSGSVGFMAGGADGQQQAMREQGMSKQQIDSARKTTPGGSAGVGSTESSQGSVTKSGISGVAGDDSVRTGDNSSAGTLVKDWSTQTIVKDVQAQAQITQQFNQQAAREIGTYADKQRDAAIARGDKEEAAKWDEGGEYRVAAHTAAGALSGGVTVAIAAGAGAALMPKIGEAIADMGLPAPVAQALGAATAAAIGGAIGGAAGAGSAYSIDINNRQLHPTERAKLKETAKQVAREQIPGFDQLTTEQKAKAEGYWYDQLAQAALARVDDKGKAERDSYLKNVTTSDQLGLQGGYSAEYVLANAATADRIVAGLANQNQPILNIYGEPVKAGKDELFAFSATAEQRANSFLLNTPTADAERQRIAKENGDTLSYLRAASGGAIPDYTIEEQLLGGAIAGKAIGALASGMERVAAAKVAAAEVDAARISNNLYRDAEGFAQVSQREFQPGTTYRAENINAGQVTDRDGLPRVGDAAKENNAQVAQNTGGQAQYWGTAYPAWKEGEMVTDRTMTQPEIYRQVVDAKQYEAIRDALRNGDTNTASQQLGGWATKDPINSMADVRGNLAITPEFKAGQLYTVEFTVKPGVGVREGTVGPMWDPTTASFLSGGGQQANFMVGRPGANPELFTINPNSIKALK